MFNFVQFVCMFASSRYVPKVVCTKPIIYFNIVMVIINIAFIKFCCLKIMFMSVVVVYWLYLIKLTPHTNLCALKRYFCFSLFVCTVKTTKQILWNWRKSGEKKNVISRTSKICLRISTSARKGRKEQKKNSKNNSFTSYYYIVVCPLAVQYLLEQFKNGSSICTL